MDENSPNTSHLHEAYRLIDEQNSCDPVCEIHDGIEYPKELLYSKRMTSRLETLFPSAPEPVRLAARSHHIRRWTISRTSFPDGRTGYLQWRRVLANFHAQTVGEILEKVGYAAPMIKRVQALIRKEKLDTDLEAQMLEDIICLVFLEHYLNGFLIKYGEKKASRVIRKTWRKMSATAHKWAVENICFGDLDTLVKEAIT